MADSERTCKHEGEKAVETAEYNPKLDFFSEEFDPLVALNTPNVTIPDSSAKTYDNIHKYKSTYELKSNENKPKIDKKAAEKVIERKWLPHQLPIQAKKKEYSKNVFIRMEAAEGPLKALKQCLDLRKKIKVFNRLGHGGIRGYCTAYVVAFDKHWNLALEDVDEVWTRKKACKVPAFDSIEDKSKVTPMITPPPINVIKSTKKTETCSRHVNQLLMRGEHIAYIVLDQ